MKKIAAALASLGLILIIFLWTREDKTLGYLKKAELFQERYSQKSGRKDNRIDPSARALYRQAADDASAALFADPGDSRAMFYLCKAYKGMKMYREASYYQDLLFEAGKWPGDYSVRYDYAGGLYSLFLILAGFAVFAGIAGATVIFIVVIKRKKAQERKDARRPGC